MLADVQSGLPGIGATIDQGRRQALVTVPLLMIQLGLLALFVLGLTLGAAVEQRRPEVARGPAARRRAGPAPAGWCWPSCCRSSSPACRWASRPRSAWPRVARHTVLDGAAPFELGRGFWLAIAGATLLLAALTWAAVASGTRDRISSLLRSVPTRARGLAARRRRRGGDRRRRHRGRSLFVTGEPQGPLALAAPALLALIVGLLLAHLIVPVATWLGGG